MARSKRRFSRRKSRPRDWVYRGAVFDAAAGIIDDLSTYTPFTKTLAAGVAAANAAVLYDSHNYVASTVAGGPFDSVRQRVTAPARAEASRAFIHRTEGVIILTPSTWTAGTSFRYGVRFGIFEQDAGVGAFLIDPLYSMWGGGSLYTAHPDVWANDRRWQHERRFAQTFSTSNDQAMWTLRFRVSVRRSLNPNECYGIFSETTAGSATLLEQMWFRTLVSDEG